MVCSIIFLILAAICNAIMDTITHHWDESIFDRPVGKITKWEMWWNPQYSWLNKYVDRNPKKPIRKILGIFDVPFTDAWHTFKSLMIVFITISISCALFNTLFPILISIIILGITWNLVFNLFYNKILKNG
jgi:hypothetical protein